MKLNSTLPGFTGSPLDRTDENRPRDEVIEAYRRQADARVMLLDELDPVVGADGRLAWLPLSAVGADAATLFLGLDEGAPRFVAAASPPAGAGARRSIWQALSTLPPAEAAIYACARSLVDWHQRHRFCASCGVSTDMIRGGWARRCGACEAEHFPRTDPVVIMLAEHNGRVLLGRQHRFPPRQYSALAGFIEVGESIEEAVARELREEAGVIATHVRYIASQPWPFPSSLMIGCFAQVASDELALDRQELEHAFWASREEVAASLAGKGDFIVPPAFAVAHTLLQRWIAESGPEAAA